MAFVQELATSITYTLRDWNGNKRQATVFAPDTVIGEDVNAWAIGAGLALVDGASNAVIDNITVTRVFTNDTPGTPPNTSNVERKGVWVSKVEGGGYNVLSIPSVDIALIQEGSDILLPSNAAVIAMSAALIDTGIFDTVGLGNYRGDALIALAELPYVRHAKSRKG